ncbi:DUF2961 domain-containing protein [Candidatus Bathyarchaeota archaeon]|nr:DUF2961 domain-containing protein [Candidatus Bathyarchaeota archaeon]
MLLNLWDLPRLRDVRRRKISSHDPTGGNRDYVRVPKGETYALAEIEGAGCIRHIWVTIRCEDRWHPRKIVLRMYWDGEREPSVEAPIGDFFGLGHGIYRNFVSLPLQMAPEDGRGLNSWWPMPFSDGARIEVENECDIEISHLYYHIDYEEYEELDEDLGRFHAAWRRENPTDGLDYSQPIDYRRIWREEKNIDGSGNYIILEAEGRGHYVGCHVDIHNLRMTDEFNWYGEGDEMIFIDGEPLPSIVGTGTEDYYCMAWCPTQEFCTPFYGLPLPGGPNWSGKISWYRYHILDPIYFQKSIRVTLEHGHANWRSDDISSTAYWYQAEPHKRPWPLLPVEERLPREEP